MTQTNQDKDLGMETVYRDPDTFQLKDQRGNLVIRVPRPMCHRTCVAFIEAACPTYCSNRVAVTDEERLQVNAEAHAHREWARRTTVGGC